jgi:glucose/arabinose dehydrogenase
VTGIFIPSFIRARAFVAGTIACTLAASGCGGDASQGTRAWSAPPSPPPIAGTFESPASLPTAAAVRVDTVARGLGVPWAMAFTPDGRVLVTERGGQVRLIEHDTLRAQPWARFDVYADDPSMLPEAGLLGIALAPDYAQSRAVYLMGTYWRGASAQSTSLPARLWRRARVLAGAPPSRWVNRVYRCIDDGARARDCRVVIDGLPSSYYHAGGAVAFGPDGMLYLGIGDALDPDAAGEAGSLAAAILRYTPDGRVPSDNPVAGSPVHARGLRNVQALAWHPETNDLFAIEHGPSGMPHEKLRAGNDELNVVPAGGDHGWPGAIGSEAPTPPLRLWKEAIAPAGLAIPAAGTPWSGSAIVAGLRSRRLHRVMLARDASGWRVAGEEVLLAGHGRLRAVAAAPDGTLWVSTSNRDGRGRQGPADDLILRLTPAATPPVADAPDVPRPEAGRTP